MDRLSDPHLQPLKTLAASLISDLHANVTAVAPPTPPDGDANGTPIPAVTPAAPDVTPARAPPTPPSSDATTEGGIATAVPAVAPPAAGETTDATEGAMDSAVPALAPSSAPDHAAATTEAITTPGPAAEGDATVAVATIAPTDTVARTQTVADTTALT